jgi:hypothetical protein
MPAAPALGPPVSGSRVSLSSLAGLFLCDQAPHHAREPLRLLYRPLILFWGEHNRDLPDTYTALGAAWPAGREG